MKKDTRPECKARKAMLFRQAVRQARRRQNAELVEVRRNEIKANEVQEMHLAIKAAFAKADAA